MQETTEADCHSAAPEMGNTLERHLDPHLGQQCPKKTPFFLNSVQLVRDLNLLAIVVVSSNKTVYIC